MSTHRPQLILAAVFGLLGLSTAPAQSLCTTFYAQDLLKGKQTIEISPGYQTILQLYDAPEWGGSARADLLNKPEIISNNRIVLTTQANNGASDFALLVRGQLIMFDMVIRPGTTGRCYTVEWQPSRPSAPATTLPRSTINTPITRPAASTPSTSTTPAQPVSTITPPREAVPAPTQPANATPIPAASPATTVTAPAPAATAPVLAASAPAPRTEGELPSWLTFNLIAVPSSMGDGKVTLFYTVENRGTNRVVMDSARIVVMQNGKPLEHSLMRLPEQYINPATSQSGHITLEQVAVGEISLHWAVVEVIADSTNGATYFIKRTINGQQTANAQGR